jgi:hypothetical protein
VTAGAGQPATRVVIVGEDAEVVSLLHLNLARAGWAPVCLPSPELLEALLPALAPAAIVLVLPGSPATSWGAALTASASAARTGVRVVLVAPSREIVEPLAAVAGAERALGRSEVLSSPLSVLERGAVPASPPPLVRRGGSGAARASAGTPAAPPAASAAREPSTSRIGPIAGRADLLSLIDEELVDEPRYRPRMTRVEVNVSLVSEHNFYVGPTQTVESGGVFISTMMPPPVGTPLEVRLGLPDGTKVDVHGEVAFLRERGATGGRQAAGCGVRLYGLPTWAADAIDLFLAARRPIVYAP